MRHIGILLVAALLVGCTIREWEGIGRALVAPDTRPRVECARLTQWSTTVTCTTYTPAPAP